MNRSITIRVVASTVVAVLSIGAWVQDGKPDLTPFKFFSAAVLVSTGIFLLWDFWLWQLKLIQKIPKVPRSVRGTWKGTLTSFWVDPQTGERPGQKVVYLTVRQTGSAITIRLLTDESRSVSALAELAEIDGQVSVRYLYLSKPDLSVEHRSRIHHGSTVLDVSGRPAQRLKGRYWTDRDSKGELEFALRSEKIADDYLEASSYFES
ncbi:hypothetical protein AB0M54_46330 [Actinoplanes sp. NPDC051470]|uniref:Cap15 family cyclic dinucleotide receptor domain-containing protein n=1 Tax=Actinoplanes sp. NPDC051470 TaxID=3157224 RepID=UPI0034211022